MTSPYAVEHANWEVMWVVTKPKKRIVAVDCGSNLSEARRLYQKVLDAEKPMATLRCKNVGFPPPEKYEDRMMVFNRQGIFWCPYCMEMRRFHKQDGFHSDLSEAWVPVQQYYCCPMCDISIHQAKVQMYNPKAMEISLARKTRLRKGKGGRKRRRRKR